MPRPVTKVELIAAANTQFDKLWQQIDSLTEAEQNAAFHFDEDFLHKQKEAHWRRDKNLRDVLVHLYEWHQLLLSWIRANLSGTPQPNNPPF